MADENLWDSVREINHEPAPKKAGWGLGAAFSKLRAGGDNLLQSHHGPTQTGLPTPPTSKSSHGADPYASNQSSHNGHGGGGLWNRFGGQDQQHEQMGNESAASEGSFWNNLRKDEESEDEDGAASYMNKNKNNNDGSAGGGLWGRVIAPLAVGAGGGLDAADESDYDTDAGADEWEQQKRKSLHQHALVADALGVSMMDDESEDLLPSPPQRQQPPPPPKPPSPKAPSPKAPNRKVSSRNKTRSRSPKARKPKKLASSPPRKAPAPPPPPPPPPPPEETDDDETDDDAMNDESFDDGDSVAPAGGGNADPMGDLGGLGAFLDKGNEKAFKAEMSQMMHPNPDDKSCADMSAIEGSVAPGEAKRLIQNRMQQRMDMSFGKSVCNMSLNPQEVETKERRPWRQQKHLRRGSALGAMPAGQLAMLGALAADDSDSEEEDLLAYTLPKDLNERPVTKKMGGFDDLWKDGNATVMSEMSAGPTTAAQRDTGFLSKVPDASQSFIQNNGAEPEHEEPEELSSMFPQTAEEMFPEELGDQPVVEDMFAPQNMLSAQQSLAIPEPLVKETPVKDPLGRGGSTHSSKKRGKKPPSRRASNEPPNVTVAEAEPEKLSRSSREQKTRRKSIEKAEALKGDKQEEVLSASRKSSRRKPRDDHRSDEKNGSSQRTRSRGEAEESDEKNRSSHRNRSSHKGDLEDEPKVRRKTSRRPSNDDPGKSRSSRRGEEDDDNGRKSRSRRKHGDDDDDDARKSRSHRGEVDPDKSSRRRKSRRPDDENRSPRSRDSAEVDAALEGSRRRSRKPSSRRPTGDNEGLEHSKHSNSAHRRKAKKDDGEGEDLRDDLRSSRTRKKRSDDKLEGSARHRGRKSKSNKEEDEEDEAEEKRALKSEIKPWRQPKESKSGDELDENDGTEKHDNTALSRLEARSRAATTKKLEKSEMVRDNSRQGTSSTGTGSTAETTGSLEFDDHDHHQIREIRRTGSNVAREAANAAKHTKKRGGIFKALGLNKSNHTKLEDNEEKHETGKTRQRRSADGKDKIPRGSNREERSQPLRGSKGEKTGILSSNGGSADDREDGKKSRNRRSTSVPKNSVGKEKSREERKEGRRSTSVPRSKLPDASDQLSESSRSQGRKKGAARRSKSHAPGEDEKRARRSKSKAAPLRNSTGPGVPMDAKKEAVRRKKSRSRPT